MITAKPAFLVSTVLLVVGADVIVSPCNQVCLRGPAHINECCKAHNFLGGYCDSTSVPWCKEQPGQERSRNARSFNHPPCDETCTNGGYVRECCRAHGFKGGVCDENKAYCDHPDDDRQRPVVHLPPRPSNDNDTVSIPARFNPDAVGSPETCDITLKPYTLHK